MGFCPIDGKECDCIVPCALPEVRLIRAHETDSTLDEYGIFVRGECVDYYEGENQALNGLARMIKRPLPVKEAASLGGPQQGFQSLLGFRPAGERRII